MSTKPLFLLRKAKKSSGEPDVVLWASNDFESTCATLDYLIVKSGKKLSSYFKAVATNFPVVNDLPAEGEIDFTWSERYQLSKDSMTWELKPGAAPNNAHYQGNTNVNGEDMTEIEENMLLPNFWPGTAHSLACSTRQRKTGNARFTRRTPGITHCSG